MKENAKRKKPPQSLHVILWICFFVFAFLTVVLFGLGEMAAIRQATRERTVKNLYESAGEITLSLDDRVLDEAQISGLLIAMSEKYDVNARIISEEGVTLFPRLNGGNTADFAAQMPSIRENVGKVYTIDSNVYVHAIPIVIHGQNGYLYISDTYTMGSAVFGVMVFQTSYIALIMLIIASVLSGAISLYISRPIADLTEKARKLSSGNLSVDFNTDEGASYQEIVALRESLGYAESELSKADQMQKELIANVSHDFKTPLTMIKAYASMIQDFSGELPEKRNQHAQVIIDEADRLATLVNDMLNLSKIRAGIESLKPTLFNLSDYLREIVMRFDYLRETAGYQFELDITGDLYIEADKDKIGQVIYNLIGNAVNYTGEDKKVSVHLYGENGVQHFFVRDTGKGIPPEEIADIWERYYRSSQTHKRPVKGTGLGLSIVKTILTKHDFKFGVQSEVGKGSTFYVDFPAKTVAEIDINEQDE